MAHHCSGAAHSDTLWTPIWNIENGDFENVIIRHFFSRIIRGRVVHLVSMIILWTISAKHGIMLPLFCYQPSSSPPHIFPNSLSFNIWPIFGQKYIWLWKLDTFFSENWCVIWNRLPPAVIFGGVAVVRRLFGCVVLSLYLVSIQFVERGRAISKIHGSGKFLTWK